MTLQSGHTIDVKATVATDSVNFVSLSGMNAERDTNTLYNNGTIKVELTGDAAYADASVRWTGSYELGTSEKGCNLGMLKPTVKVGIRQALMDPEVSFTMNIFGRPNTTYIDANETAFLCEAGLAWDMGDVDVSLTYSGEFGDVEYSHMGMFKVEWTF